MSKLAVLTKTRFSLLHLAALIVVAFFCITLATHWDACMAVYHDGYNAASSLLRSH